MAVYRASAGTATRTFWHVTSSWVTASTLATAPASWVTASSLPGPSDDVYLHGVFFVDARIIPSMSVNSINGTSGSSGATGVMYIHGIDQGAPFRIIAPAGITSSRGTVSAVSMFVFTPESTPYTSNINVHVSASIQFVAQSIAVSPIFGQRSLGGSGGLNILISGSCRVDAGAGGAGWLALLNYASSRNNSITINGDVTGSTIAGSAINSSIVGTQVTINGNVLMPATTATTAYIVQSTNNYTTVAVNGNIETRGSSSAVSFTGTAPNYINIVGNITGSPAAPTISTTVASDTEVLVYGNIRNSGSRTAIVAPKQYVTASANLIIATGSIVSATQSFFQNISTVTYPAEWDVYVGKTYGDAITYTGTMTAPSASHVRSGSGYSSGSISAIAATSGSCFIPSASHTRLGVLVNTAPTAGLMIVPIASQVSNSKAFDSYGATGTYSGSKDFWATPHNIMTTGIGALISQSFNVRAGSITGSLVGMLDTDTSNTVTRLRSIASVADVGNSLTQSAMI